MNMFLHELRAYRKSTIIWTIAICGVALMYLSIYPSFSKDIGELKKLLEGYPEGIRKAMGLTVESFSTVLGFYSVIFSYIMLCGAIQAMNLGTSIVSKEIREKTADFLLTKPVSRSKVLTAKLLAALTSIIMTNVIYIIVAAVIARLANTQSFSMKIFLMISLTMFFVQVMFMALGIIISVVVGKIRSVIAVSLGTVFSFFIIAMLGSAIGEKAVRYVTPFKYYDTSYILSNSSYEGRFVILEIVFVVVAIIASYLIYTRKDVHAV